VSLLPSYVAKLNRAKRHLVELESAVDRFTNTHPYEVATSVEGKKKRKIRRINFTSSPDNTEIPEIAADVVYNLRSALDHLMAALVAPSERTHVYFPIYFHGVWEPAGPREDPERTKQRGRWMSDTQTVSEGALAVLKKLQPPATPNLGETNLLTVINSLSNTDRHTKFPVLAQGLRGLIVNWTMPNGTIGTGGALAPTAHFLKNQAQIGKIPYRAVNVDVYGEPVIAVRVGFEGKRAQYIEIPKDFVTLIKVMGGGDGIGVAGIIPDLIPHVRADAP
jgi:hypothetical protein